jgi:membrane protein YqaA with SNARE-associated domain
MGQSVVGEVRAVIRITPSSPMRSFPDGAEPPAPFAEDMSMLAQLALAVGVVFAVNLLPAFGPPTWAVLVFFSLDFDLPAVPLVLGGAVAAAAGRFILANGARHLRPRLSTVRLEHLDRAQATLGANRLRTLGGLALFIVSPLPSGQLFVAAGLMTVPLLPLTAAFFTGRLVSYSIYVGAATIAERNFGDLLLDALTSPLGMVLQVAMLIGLALLAGGIRPGGPSSPGLPLTPRPTAPIDADDRGHPSGSCRSFAVALPGWRGAGTNLDSGHRRMKGRLQMTNQMAVWRPAEIPTTAKEG